MMNVKVTSQMEISPDQVARVLVKCSESEFKNIFLKIELLVTGDKGAMEEWRAKGRWIGTNPGMAASFPVDVLYKFSQYEKAKEIVDNGGA